MSYLTVNNSRHFTCFFSCILVRHEWQYFLCEGMYSKIKHWEWLITFELCCDTKRMSSRHNSHIWTNNPIMDLDFSKLLRKLVAKYVSTILREHLKKISKELSNINAYAMFLCVFFLTFFIKAHVVVLIWTALTSRCNSNGHPQHMSV